MLLSSKRPKKLKMCLDDNMRNAIGAGRSVEMATCIFEVVLPTTLKDPMSGQVKKWKCISISHSSWLPSFAGGDLAFIDCSGGFV